MLAFIFNKSIQSENKNKNKSCVVILFSKNKISNYLNYIIKKIYINKRLVV